MAFVGADYALDQGLIDFNAVLRVPHQTVTFLPGTGKFEGETIPVGKISLGVPDHTFVPTSGVKSVADTGFLFESLVGHDFAYDAGRLVGGIATGAIIRSHQTGADLAMVGMSISAADFSAAALTASTVDDRAIIGRILAGNDLLDLSGEKDWINSGAGKDLIASGGGNDNVSAGSGADLVTAGAGADTVIGGLGADILLGEAGSDRIFGGGGNDTIVGGAGNDILVGDGGADRFVFARGAGQDHIRGFTVGSDKIAIESGAANFAALAITQLGNDTVIRFGTVKITLDGIDDATVTATSFQFANALPHIGVAGAAAQQWLDGWNYLV